MKRAIELVGGPVTLVGHSYGGFVITNATHNNQNVIGLVYIVAFAPMRANFSQISLTSQNCPPGLLVFDSGGFVYINPAMFPQAFAQDVNSTEASVMGWIKSQLINQPLVNHLALRAWKQLPTWYQVSEDDHMIPPDAEHMFAQRMNATTISINSSHASLVSHPDEVAQLILNATKGSMDDIWWCGHNRH